jgi:hypothetical protein
MRTIQLDAAAWKSPLDLHTALKGALGSCEGHGSSPAAWVDSMIWGGMNTVEPPYLIKFVGTAECPASLREDIRTLIRVIAEARRDRLNQGRGDIEVVLVEADFLH